MQCTQVYGIHCSADQQMMGTEEDCVQLVSHVLPDLVEQSPACCQSDLFQKAVTCNFASEV